MTGTRWLAASLALSTALLACSKSADPPATCSSPVAVLGGDQTVARNTRVEVDASASKNLSSADRITWDVRDPSGSPVVFFDSGNGDESIAFVTRFSGTYLVTVTLESFESDCGGRSTATGRVTSVDSPPFANAGSDVTTHAGTVVHLDGSRSTDPDSDPLEYRWSVVSAPNGSAASIATPLNSTSPFIPDLPGEYTLGLVVSDGELDSAQATVQITATNQAPTVSLLEDRYTVRKGSTVFINSTGYDADGDTLGYSWSLSSAPAGSSASVPSAAQSYLDFKPDIEGDYELTLTVSDGFSSASANATVTATNEPPSVNAGPDVAAIVGQQVSLAGDAFDPDADALSYLWTIDSAPAGSNANITNSDALAASFVPDLEGSYTLTLTASDRSTSASDSMVVSVVRDIVPLAHDVIWAAKGDALGKLVLASSSPSNSLYLYDPVSQIESAVALPLAPHALALSADGQHAAVGHNGYVSYVDLAAAARVGNPMPVPIDVDSVALTADFIYASARGTNPAPIYAVQLADGGVTTSAASGGGPATVQPGSKLALTGDGNGLYVADGATLDKFQPLGPPAYLYSTPYTASEAGCGNLWFVESQAKLVTACGLLFSVDSTSTTAGGPDLVYAGALDGYSAGGAARVQWADDSAAAQELAAIPSALGGGDDRQLELYSDGYFNRVATLALPGFAVSGQVRPAHGRFVFHSPDGARRYVIVQSEDSSGALSSDFGVVTF